MNYWYASQSNEIFLDLDSNRATARALSVLRLAIRKDLPVREVWLYGTRKAHHAHMIIVLKKDMPFMTRMAWALWLGNDRLRTAYVIERALHVAPSCSDLLVTKRPYYRAWDSRCQCRKKHKPKAVTDKCPAMGMFLGNQRSADYFTRTGKAPPRKKIRVPWGKVSLKQIRNWSDR